MSAIWGAIDFKGNKICDTVKSILKEAYSECVIDRVEELSDNNIYMGCGIQYFTEEAKKEVLPVKYNNVLFNADVILDNRKEIMAELKIKSDDITDGELLFQYYESKRDRTLNTLLGAYCFVRYDKDVNEIDVVSDAVGYRFVYYTFKDGILYYSSLMSPLEKIIGKCTINNRYIGDYLLQDNLNIFTECEETPIDGIYRIAPAQKMVFSKDKIRKYQYWDPTAKVKKIKYKTDEEYKKHFRNLYKECVESVLRSSNETAMLLSGGFDSTSVAAFAVPKLKDSGKIMHAFTSVPFKGYESEFSKEYIVDETELVKKTVDYYGNIDCTFMDLPEMNPWFDRKYYSKIAEIPYKSPQNLLWMYQGQKQAYKKGCRILLMGAFGNGTVSFDNQMPYMTWLFTHFRWRTLYNEIQILRNKFFYTRKSVMRTTIANAIPWKCEKTSFEEITKDTFARKEFLKKYAKVNDYIKKCNMESRGYCKYDIYINSFITLNILRHYGEFAQKTSLYSGVIIRDPTRDKRIIEFTRAIPKDQFTKDGCTRRLIREYMSDLMPQHIINEKRIGRQSADLKARILQNKDTIRKEWMECLLKHNNNQYIDCEKAVNFIEQKAMENMTDFEMVRIIYTCIFLEYADKYK